MRRVLTALTVLIASATGTGPVQSEPSAADATSTAPIIHPMIIENPSTLGSLETDLRDVLGKPIGIQCGTCHAAGSGEALANREASPSGLHAGIELDHGELRCDSCHSPTDRTRLRLADGEMLEMHQVIRLCGQCHSGQYKSFLNAAHGGARGYWDQSRGPMIRNNCVTCHHAHQPKYPMVWPAPPPNDRFLPRSKPLTEQTHD